MGVKKEDGEELPLFVFVLSFKHDETERLDCFECDRFRNVFDLERDQWYRRGITVNGGSLLFRGRGY